MARCCFCYCANVRTPLAVFRRVVGQGAGGKRDAGAFVNIMHLLCFLWLGEEVVWLGRR